MVKNVWQLKSQKRVIINLDFKIKISLSKHTSPMKKCPLLVSVFVLYWQRTFSKGQKLKSLLPPVLAIYMPKMQTKTLKHIIYVIFSFKNYISYEIHFVQIWRTW